MFRRTHLFPRENTFPYPSDEGDEGCEAIYDSDRTPRNGENIQVSHQAGTFQEGCEIPHPCPCHQQFHLQEGRENPYGDLRRQYRPHHNGRRTFEPGGGEVLQKDGASIPCWLRYDGSMSFAGL